jgi:glycosyl transferase family 25
MTSLSSAFLLNLDRDTERLEHMRDQLKKAHISFERLSGILGDALPADLRSYFFAADGSPLTTMKRGELGCYASHVRALQLIASGAYGEAVLVMEDDLDIETGFRETLQEAFDRLPQKWDILRLSSPPRRAFLPVALLKGGRLLVKYSKIPNSAGAYVVTPQGAKKFLARGIRGLTFDDDLRRPWFHDLATFGIAPPPIRAGVLSSTIDAIEAGRFDKGISSRQERIRRGDHKYLMTRLLYNIRYLGFFGWLRCQAINIADMIAKPILRRHLFYSVAYWFGDTHADH